MSDDYRIETRRCPRPADPRKNMMDCRLDWFDAALYAVTDFWANTRDELQLVGVTPRASLYGSFFAGAGEPIPGPVWGGTLALSLALDVGKLAGAPKGLSVYVGGVAAWSKEPWPFPMSVNYLRTDAWLNELYVQQSLLDGALVLSAGRLQPAMTFAFLPVMLNHVGPVLIAGWLAFDEPPYPPGPASQWGVQGVWTIAHQFQVATGVYGNNPYSARGASHGFDWQLWEGNEGVYVMGQASWMPGAKPGTMELPGLYAIGGWYDGNRFPDLGTGASTKGSYGFYVQGQQMLLRQGGVGNARGITVWDSHLDAARGREPDAARRDRRLELARLRRRATERHHLARRVRRPVLAGPLRKSRPGGARVHIRPRAHRRLLRPRRPAGDVQRQRGRGSERLRGRAPARTQPVTFLPVMNGAMPPRLPATARRIRASILATAFLSACGGCGGSDTAAAPGGPTGPTGPTGATFRVVTLNSSLTSPWGLAFLPDGRMLVTQKGGTMVLLVRRRRLAGDLDRPAARGRGRAGRPARRRARSGLRHRPVGVLGLLGARYGCRGGTRRNRRGAREARGRSAPGHRGHLPAGAQGERLRPLRLTPRVPGRQDPLRDPR